MSGSLCITSMGILDSFGFRLETKEYSKPVHLIVGFLIRLWTNKEYFNPLLSRLQNIPKAQRSELEFTLVTLDSYIAAHHLKNSNADLATFYALLSNRLWEEFTNPPAASKEEFAEFLKALHAKYDDFIESYTRESPLLGLIDHLLSTRLDKLDPKEKTSQYVGDM